MWDRGLEVRTKQVQKSYGAGTLLRAIEQMLLLRLASSPTFFAKVERELTTAFGVKHDAIAKESVAVQQAGGQKTASPLTNRIEFFMCTTSFLFVSVISNVVIRRTERQYFGCCSPARNNERLAGSYKLDNGMTF